MDPLCLFIPEYFCQGLNEKTKHVVERCGSCPIFHTLVFPKPQQRRDCAIA